MTARAVVATPAAFQAAGSIRDISGAGATRWPRLTAGAGHLLDGLLLLAVAFSIPFVILLVGTPLALALRALLWLIAQV